MKKWSEFPANIARKIRVVFTDIDDTLSTKGKILPEAYTALWNLFRGGIDIVPITGRSAGWVDHIARMWPVKGVIGENGAFYAYMDNSGKISKLKKRYYLKPEQAKQASIKFEDIKREVFTRFPTCKVASDQNYRDFDLAIDFCEDVPPLNRAQIQEIVNIFEKYGANTKISSIHVNGWFGTYDKLTMTKIFCEEVLNFSLDLQADRAIFIGDSPNDQPMFEFFPNSVGVQNIKNFLSEISCKPTYITDHEGSLGFAEMAERLLESSK